MNKNKNRKKVIAFLLMLSLILTSGSFAYWASYVEGTSEEAVGTLTIGSADGVETRFELSNEFNSGGQLVPYQQAKNSGDLAVEEVFLSYDIAWQEDEIESQLQGTESIGQLDIAHYLIIELDGEVLSYREYAYIYDLIHVEYSKANATHLQLDAEPVTVSFTVTMDEPANQYEYNLISTAKVYINFYFDIDDKDIETTDLESGEPIIIEEEPVMIIEEPVVLIENNYDVLIINEREFEVIEDIEFLLIENDME